MTIESVKFYCSQKRNIDYILNDKGRIDVVPKNEEICELNTIEGNISCGGCKSLNCRIVYDGE